MGEMPPTDHIHVTENPFLYIIPYFVSISLEPIQGYAIEQESSYVLTS
jgi:hypothetical protein